jgi:undecaprenyl-diphosphatase
MGLNETLSLALNSLVGRSSLGDAGIAFFASYLAFVLVAIALVALYRAHWSRDKKIRAVLIATVSTIVARYGVVEAIRAVYPNPRPFAALSEIRPLFTDASSSFPSGHASFFFTLAAVVYCYDTKLGLWFALAALLMGIGRIVAGVHYPADILAGAIVGYVVGTIVFRLAERYERSLSA